MQLAKSIIFPNKKINDIIRNLLLSAICNQDVWWLEKDLRKEQKKCNFTQRKKSVMEGGGSLVFEIKCWGHRELIHELLHPDWLGYVKIESPDRLKEEFLEYVEMVKSAV